MIQRLASSAVRSTPRQASALLLRRAAPVAVSAGAAPQTLRAAQHHSLRFYSAHSGKPPSGSTSTLGHSYPRDDYTNVPSSILSRLHTSPVLPYRPSHPLTHLRSQIEQHLSSTHVALSAPSPIVSVETNFGALGFPADHPGRAPSDTYYLNRQTCLRTHTSAHEVDVFKRGHTHWLLTADVYRRDEVDASHYPVFHQMEGAAIWSAEDFEAGGRVQRECEEMEKRLAGAKVEIEDEVKLEEAGGWQTCHTASPAALRAAELSARHLKATLNGLVLALFGPRHAADLAAAKGQDAVTTTAEQEPLRVRWIAASFPFTSPSFEVEVWFRGRWLEILGCGVVKQNTLDNAGIAGKTGWAFGLGLERIAMVLFSIPDIRLFWSQDQRFISQFASSSSSSSSNAGISSSGGLQQPTPPLVTFKPYSKYPPCLKDISFWLPTTSSSSSSAFHENDFCEIVRDEARDLAEDVRLIDEFVHPKTGRVSKCYRINYRSMDRNLEHGEINALHAKISKRLVEELGIEPR